VYSIGPLCKKFLSILEYKPIFSPSFRAYDISIFFVKEKLNKLYIKTHIIPNYSGKNIPPFAAGKLK
jgi:hypothetical protein